MRDIHLQLMRRRDTDISLEDLRIGLKQVDKSEISAKRYTCNKCKFKHMMDA